MVGVVACVVLVQVQRPKVVPPDAVSIVRLNGFDKTGEMQAFANSAEGLSALRKNDQFANYYLRLVAKGDEQPSILIREGKDDTASPPAAMFPAGRGKDSTTWNVLMTLKKPVNLKAVTVGLGHGEWITKGTYRVNQGQPARSMGLALVMSAEERKVVEGDSLDRKLTGDVVSIVTVSNWPTQSDQAQRLAAFDSLGKELSAAGSASSAGQKMTAGFSGRLKDLRMIKYQVRIMRWSRLSDLQLAR